MDVNEDGMMDLVTANDDGARLLIGDGRGRFAAPRRVPSGFFTVAVAAADFNADGRLDLVTVDSDGTLTALLGEGLGSSPLSRVCRARGGRRWSATSTATRGRMW